MKTMTSVGVCFIALTLVALRAVYTHHVVITLSSREYPLRFSRHSERTLSHSAID